MAATVLEGWAAYAPALRGAVLDLLLSREPWTDSLLAAIEGVASWPPRSTAPGGLACWPRPARKSARGPRHCWTPRPPPARRSSTAIARRSTWPATRRPAPPSSSGPARPATSRGGGGRGRPGPGRPDRQVARGPADRHPRPESGLRVALRRLQRRDQGRPRPDRPDRRRDGQRRDPAPAGGQRGHPLPRRHRGDGRLGPVAHARGPGERPLQPRPRRPDRLPDRHRPPARSSRGTIPKSSAPATTARSPCPPRPPRSSAPP